MLFKTKKPAFSITVARHALESIYDECDKYNVDETGGRLVGTYKRKGDRYDILVQDVIAPGPNARRTSTSFFQDGDYQERTFREMEEVHPDIEHLGNWHTHHVNGYPTLSGGDIETYLRIVNHPKHNTNFFYALLVVSRNDGGRDRYGVRHYVLRRGEGAVYEVPPKDVHIVDLPSLNTAVALSPRKKSGHQANDVAANPERAKDGEFFAEFYPDLKPLLSKKTGAPYWKGHVSLADGSDAEIVAMENLEDRTLSYSIATSSRTSAAETIAKAYGRKTFRSARHAVISFERDLNRALFGEKEKVQ